MTVLKQLFISDTQFPYHDKRVLDLWFKFAKWWKPDVIDILGDISDQAGYSRFTEGSSAEFLNTLKKTDSNPHDFFPIVQAEEKLSREFYTQVREMFPSADIFSALGNHDIRVFDYVDKKMPDLLSQVTPESLWNFKNLGIDYIYYSDLPKKRYGDLYVHHGISALKGSGDSVKSDIADLGVSLVRGHSHRQSEYFKTQELKGEILRGWEIGHCADVKSEGMSYTNIRNWQAGWAYAYLEPGSTTTTDGYWAHVNLVTVSPDYTIVVNGRTFKA
jgi:hypothetical protein